MFVGADYYIRHNDEVEQQETPIDFKAMPLSRFADLVNKASRRVNNTDRRNDTITTADSYSFQIAYPEYLRTENNKRIIDHYLATKGITCPTFPDFLEAVEHYKDSGVLDIDAAELARDKRGRTYVGVYSKQRFHSVDDLIAAERVAALTQVKPSDEVDELEKLPPEEACALIKEAERQTQQQANSAAIQASADAWLILNKGVWVDDTRNAHLMERQLKINGVTNATPADFQKASQQLLDSGLVRVNQAAVDRQHARDVQQLATEAAAAVFDKTTEAQAEQLPLDELRRRANGNFTGVGV